MGKRRIEALTAAGGVWREGDPGFDGQYTLEVTVIHPLRVYAGMRVAQMRFHTIVGEVQTYHGNYTGEGARGPVASRAYRQFDRTTGKLSPRDGQRLLRPDECIRDRDEELVRLRARVAELEAGSRGE